MHKQLLDTLNLLQSLNLQPLEIVAKCKIAEYPGPSFLLKSSTSIRQSSHGEIPIITQEELMKRLIDAQHVYILLEYNRCLENQNLLLVPNWSDEYYYIHLVRS